MSKKIIIVIAIAVVIGLAIMTLLPKQSSVLAYYQCEPGYTFMVEFNDQDAVVTLPGGRDLDLDRVDNSNGMRYRNSDSTNEFWVQSGEAILRVDGEIKYDSCIARDVSVPSGDLTDVPSWEQYVSNELTGGYQFVIQHPDQVKINEVPEGASFSYQGKRDNYFNVSITVEPTIVDDVLGTVDSFDEVVFNGAKAYSYVDESNQLTLAVVLEDATTAFITYEIDGNNQFQQAVSMMVESIVFAPSPAEVSEVTTEEPITQVPLALLQPGQALESGSCDTTVIVMRDVLPTMTPVTDAMNLLFELRATEIDSYLNQVPTTTDTLQFNRVSVVNGLANVYLSGELSGVVTACDRARVGQQITDTLLEFEVVNDVQIYLNGQPVDDLANAVGAQG